MSSWQQAFGWIFARGVIALLCLSANPLSAKESRMIGAVKAEHPRILLTDQRVGELKTLLKTDKNLQHLVSKLEALGEVICKQEPLKRKLVGKKRFRLLRVSRQVLSRALVLGTLYRLDGQDKWKQRLTEELKAVCAFEDWYPKHYLDTSEMSAAVAIGYDWVYKGLSKEDRSIIRDGLIKHGLEPGLKGGWWVKATNNWNQVCHCGMVLTALALAPDRADDCEKLLVQAKKNYVNGMKAYAPAGVYPEGPAYWNYGTSFSVFMASALNSVLADDWGILKMPGFKESFDYRLHVQSPTGKVVNYADGGEGVQSSPYHFYLASQTKKPGYAAFAFKSLSKDFTKIDWIGRNKESDTGVNRLLALAVAWFVPEIATVERKLDWFANGESKVHVAFMRSAWEDQNALFASLKTGRLQVSHGHLDNGSFIIEANGVRWASDMGSDKEIYDRNDSWATKQTSKRWEFFRANNFGHNTLTIDGQIQNVKGTSPIVATAGGDSPFAIANLSAAYAGQAKSVKRGITLLNRKAVLIQDEISGVAKGKVIRWNMMTRTKIEVANAERTATLSHEGKTMTVKLQSPANAKFSVKNAKPKMDIENQNEGWQRLVVDVVADSNDNVITVIFVPQGVAEPKAAPYPLAKWKSVKNKN